MPINLQGSGNIAEGWGPPPQLHAPEIGSLVHAILSNRLARDKMTQESIADTIKNIQGQRESAAYTDALQKAGLLPEGDYGGLGMKGGSSLATILQRKQALDALEAHRSAMEARVGGRGGRSGDGGAGYPETTWDEQGREWRPGPGGRWIPVKPVGSGQSGTTKEPNIAKAVKEELGLQETLVEHEEQIAKERAANIEAKLPNVPYSQSDVYNTTKNRLKQLQEIPGMPSTAPQGVPQPAGADKAGGHAQDYGTKAVYMKAPDGTVSPVDPNLVEFYKSKGAVVVAGP